MLAGYVCIAICIYMTAIDDDIPRPVDLFLRWRFEIVLRFIKICFLFLGICWIFL